MLLAQPKALTYFIYRSTRGWLRMTFFTAEQEKTRSLASSARRTFGKEKQALMRMQYVMTRSGAARCGGGMIFMYRGGRATRSLGSMKCIVFGYFPLHSLLFRVPRKALWPPTGMRENVRRPLGISTLAARGTRVIPEFIREINAFYMWWRRL